jgi:hypothetical protein
LRAFAVAVNVPYVKGAGGLTWETGMTRRLVVTVSSWKPLSA